MARRFPHLVALIAAIGVIAGCSDGGSETNRLVVEGRDIVFDADEYRVAAGALTIELVEEGILPHSLVIEDADGTVLDFRLLVDTDERRSSGDLSLDTGTYTLFCDIPGHRAAGMVSTLIVVGGGSPPPPHTGPPPAEGAADKPAAG
ncbi:MAG: plastocyanin/azurin family copper-binding protein, partial [Actinomycetota bacterium]